MDYIENITSKASNYKEYLLEYLKKDKRFVNIINSIFFPLSSNIIEYLEWTEVKSFYEQIYKGEPTFNTFCTREEIDNLPSFNVIQEEGNRYRFFSYEKFNTYEEANDKANEQYYLIQKNFYERLDKIIFEKLAEYKRRTNNHHLYERKISNSVNLILSTGREYEDIKGIIGYTFPSLSINIKNQGKIKFGSIDVRNLLFLRSGSFHFFYSDSQNYTIDKQLRTIMNITAKKDEPKIYYLEDEKKYLVTNSPENIERYNKYIQIILELSIHCFLLFEKWLTETIDRKHLQEG